MLNGALVMGLAFVAKDMASDVMGQISDKFRGLHKEGTLAGKAMTAAFDAFKIGTAIMGAGLGLIGGAFKLAEAYGEMDDALDKVALRTRLTADEMESLEMAAYEAALKTKFKPEQAVAGLEVLAKKFGDVDMAARQIIPVLNLAAVSMGDLGVADAAKLATSLLTNFNMKAEQTGDVVDKLARAQQVLSLTTKDYGAGLKRAAGTAGQFNQSLDDMLIGISLMKSRGLEGTRGVMAYNQVLTQLATNTKAQGLLESKHVQVYDKASGKMRDFTAIVGDLAVATKDMSEKDRDAFLKKALGTKGMTAYDAVAKATFKTMKDGVPVTLKGAEAIAAMRAEMNNATGAAQALTDAMLDDFGGQAEQIASATGAIRTMLAKEFAMALKPVVVVTLSVVRSIGEAFRTLPAPIKQSLTQAVLALGVFLTAIGGLIAGAAGLTIVILAAKAIGTTFLGVLATIVPFLAVGAALAGVLYGFKYAVDKNIGGVGDTFRKVFGEVKLAVQALFQLFTQGGFTGEVRKAMGEEAHRPVREFAITVYLWVNRIKTFFASLGDGFRQTFAVMGPTFTEFVAALQRLGAAFGVLQDKPDVARGKFQEWGAAGRAVGRFLGDVFDAVAQAITAVANVVSGLPAGWKALSPVIEKAATGFGSLVDAVTEVVDALLGTNTATGDTVQFWVLLGNVIGGAIGILASFVGTFAATLAMVVSIVGGVVGAIRGLITMIYDVITGLGATVAAVFAGDWAAAWANAKGVVASFAIGVLDIIGSLLEGIAGAVDKLGKVFGKDFGARASLHGIREQLRDGAREALGTIDQKTVADKERANAEKRGMIADGERMGDRAANFVGPPRPPVFGDVPPIVPAGGAQRAGADSGAMASAAAAAAVAAVKQAPAPITTVTVMLDGEELSARVQSRVAGGGAAAGNQTPVSS